MPLMKLKNVKVDDDTVDKGNKQNAKEISTVFNFLHL